MKHLFSLSGLLSIFLLLGHAGKGTAQEAGLSASELAGKMSAGMQDGSATVRLKMETGSGTVLQLQIKSRRTAAGTDLLYQVLWPKDRKGEGFVLRKRGNGAPSGHTFTPPNSLKPIPTQAMDEGVFGSELAYADLVENFYSWDQQKITGTEVVDRIPCVILESKPGGGEFSIYSMVRSWVDTKRLVPLRVEKFNRSGQMVCRVTTTKVAKDDTRRNVAASFTVQRAGKPGVTTLEGSNSKHDVTHQDATFSPEALSSGVK